MKLPYDPNYTLMKLPYSTVEFPCHLTHDPMILAPGTRIFGRFTQEPFVFWPSSWNYPEMLLRDAFAILACTRIEQDEYGKDFAAQQLFRTFVLPPFELVQKLRDVCAKKNIGEKVPVEDLTEDEEEYFKFSWCVPYTFHGYTNSGEVTETPFFEQNTALSEVSQGAAISSLKPEMFDRITELEYECETRILAVFQYKPALWDCIVPVDISNYEIHLKDKEERIEEVEEAEKKRTTPMKPRW